MRPVTLRGRLALTMTALSVGVLAAASLVIYLGVRHTLQRNLDEALLAIVRAEVASSLDGPGGQVHVHEEEPSAIDLPESAGYEKLAQIRDAEGRVLAHTSNLRRNGDLTIDAALVAAALAGESAFGDCERSGAPYRAVYYPLHDVALHPLVAIVAVPTRPLEHALATVLGALVVALLGGGVAAAWASRGLARRLTRPLETIAEAAHMVGEQSLDARIPEVSTDRELRDVTDILNDMLARLEAAFVAQRRFVADASHELRSPLSNVRGTLEVALRRPRSPDDYRQTLATCLAEVERLGRLVNGLLTLSRSDAGLMTLSLGLCDLADVARQAAAAYATRAAEAGVRVALDAPAALPLEGDGDRLRELADILLDNALRYAPRGSTVVVHVGRGAGRPTLSVADAGPGLSPEAQAHVFERFYRADDARARGSGGLGLGLSIARAIARAHGALLTIRSAPGDGTTFTLDLPARSARDHLEEADVG